MARKKRAQRRTGNASGKPATTRRRAARRRNSQAPGGLGNMSKCAKDYVRSLADPYTAPPACIPSFPSLPSEKFKVWNRGTWNVFVDDGGSPAVAAVNYILYNPWRMITSDAPSGGGTPIFYTGFGGATTGSSFPAGSTPTGTVGGALSNSPFTQAQLTAGQLSFRLVSAGLRIKWSGTRLNQGGVVSAVHTADHGQLALQAVASINARDECIRDSLTNHREWLSVNYHPVDQDDFDYVGNNSASGQTWCMAVVVGVPTAGTFEYEAFANFEATGAAARAKTTSVADPVGLGAVTNAFSLDVGLQQPSWNTDLLWNRLQVVGGELIGKAVSGMGIYAGNQVMNRLERAVFGPRRPQITY